MESYSFKDLVTGNAIKGVNCIVIPKIQRDYAQGRVGQRATDVRNMFSRHLVATLLADDNPIQKLDFIYGYLRDGNFEPLDGQQRLTTLFLLHWLVLPDGHRELLVADSDSQQPVLSYQTRPSSRDFCKFLVNIDITYLAKAYDDAANKAIAEEKQCPKLSSFIKELEEFRYNWEFDPTVNSMLRMLDTLMSHLGTFERINALEHEKLNNIQFNLRNLDDLEQGDELYVKMNARGLELSDFDNTKASLESDMISINLDSESQASWRRGMDGLWIDFFWHRAGADHPGKELNLKKIHAIEDDLKTFVLRLAVLRFFEKYYGTASTCYEEKIADLTELKCSKRGELSATFMEYLLLRFMDEHSLTPGLCPAIGYEDVIADINSLLYECNGVILAADSLSQSVKRYNDSSDSFIDSVLGGDFAHGDRIILYGMLAFTRKFSASEIARNPMLQNDWTTWIRLIRNLSLARNSNTPFDAPEDVKKAMGGISEFIDAFVKKHTADSSLTMSQFIIETSHIAGFDDAIYQEERQKEQLRSDTEWAECLDRFENEGYLFGQLRAPLQWSRGDIVKFKQYCNALNALIDENTVGIKLYIGLLLTSDCKEDRYPLGDSLLLFNNDRDRSFKRYLREKYDGQYAPALRKLVELWVEDYSEMSNPVDFLNAVIEKKCTDSTIPLWKRQLAEYPCLIWEKSHRRRIDVSDNVYLIESKQYAKRWNVNLCWLKKTKYSDDYFVIHNTKEENEVRDAIFGGKLRVADAEHGDLLVGATTHKPRFRTISKGLRRTKLQRKN